MSESVTTSDDAQLFDSTGWPEVIDGEITLNKPLELVLWRQVHKDHLSKDGIVDNMAFSEVVDPVAMRGTPDARDEVSMSRSDRLTAQEAYEDWIARGRTSIGTFGLTIGEVLESDCRTLDDSALLDPSVDIPGHVYVDMRKHPDSPKHIKRRIRSTLAAYATKRMKQFPLS